MLKTGDWIIPMLHGREGFFAAIASLRMIGLIKKGRTAEIDSLFIFFTNIVLLVWLNGYIRQWKPALFGVL
jgi:hypothetical protein